MAIGEQTIRDYLTKLGNHDLAGCIDYFQEDSVLEVRAGTQRGIEAIKAWHGERFKANLSIISIDSVNENGSETVADFVMTSDRLEGRRLENLPVRLTVSVEGKKIVSAQLRVRLGAGLKGILGLK